MRLSWMAAVVSMSSCVPFEDRGIVEIPLPADAAACLDEQRAVLGETEVSACLYLPELECALRVPLHQLCAGEGCRFAGWEAPRCTRGAEPRAELDRNARVEATLRLVRGPQCPPHEEVYATGAAGLCQGSGLEGGGCFARLDFPLVTDPDGQLVPEDDRVLARLSAAFAEELSRQGTPAPCGGEVEPFLPGRVCVQIEGEGVGEVRSAPFPELGCVRTSSAVPETRCDEQELVAGRVLRFEAEAGACSQFAGFSDACSGASCRIEVEPGGCERNRVVARFDREPLTVGVTVEGGGQVRIEPLASACPPEGPCPAICGAGSPCLFDVACGEALTLVALPDPGFELSRWGDEPCDAAVSACALGPIIGRRQVAVRFAQGEQTLRVAAEGLCRERIRGPERLECGDGLERPADCVRRVAELTAVELSLETRRDARVEDWGPACGELGCEAEPERVRFVMPTRAVELSPQVAYPRDLAIDGPGSVDGPEGRCDGPGPCPRAFTSCRAPETLEAVPRDLGTCRSELLGWTVNDNPACDAEASCELPPPEAGRRVRAQFGLPVSTQVLGRGSVTVSTPGGRSVMCAAGATCPLPLPAGVEVEIEASVGSRPLCFTGCSADFARDRCTVRNDACRSPEVRLGRRVDVVVNGPCTVTAPAPSPRSAGDRSCLDEPALSVGPGRATRTYAAAPLDLSALGSAPGVEVVSFERCDLLGQCVSAPIPPPSQGTFTLPLPGVLDVEARIACEVVFPVTVQVAGPGAVSGGAVQGCRAAGGSCAARVRESETLSLAVTPDPGARFLRWEAVQGALPCATDANPCRFRPLEAVTLRAVLLDEVSLSVGLDAAPAGAAAGRIRSLTSGVPAAVSEIDCPTRCQVPRLATQTVTLEALPAPGFRFDGFTGPCTGTGPATCRVSPLDRSRSVQGRFVAERQLSVTVTGGTIAAPGLACMGSTCSGTYDEATSVTLTASPPGPGTYRYAWSGACAGSTGPTCTLTMTQNRTASVTITQQTLTVSVTVAGGAGARVGSTPAGIDCEPGGVGTCSFAFDLGTTVSLRGAPVASTRTTWGGDCAGVSGDTCGLDAQGSATSVTRSATFTYAPLASLSVAVSGDPAATVASSPAGISGCGPGGGGCAAEFLAGAAVTLQVSGSTLAASFGGGCTVDGADPSRCEIVLPAVRGASVTVPIQVGP